MNSFPDIEFVIRQAFKQLLIEKVKPWVFLNSDKMKTITDFNGRKICYKGVSFEGSPRLVFWNDFIEPFLEAIIIWSFEFSCVQAERKHYPLLQVLKYVKNYLLSSIKEIYSEMQDIDRRLKGKGYPSRVTPYDITGKLLAMKQIIDGNYQAVLPKKAEEPIKGRRPLIDAFEFKPNVYGLGVDLKKVIEFFRKKKTEA